MGASVFHSLEEAQGHFGPCALAIGNFDGVHIGHQALLSETLGFVSQNGLIPAALTFHPHPTVIVAPDRVPPLICTLEQRIRLLERAGAARILVLPFTPELARLSPEEFVWKILVQALQTKAVFVGDNFRFGHKHAGTPATLRSLGERFGFVSQFVQPVTFRGEVISSSTIRQYLAAGNVGRAARLLGRCFSIEGSIVPGQGVGSKQTVPTLNLAPPPGQLIPRGVFITETLDLSTHRRWPSITNAGVRPTFGAHDLTIETFLLAPLEGPALEKIQVQFCRFIRAERQFPTPEALKTQILKDVSRAQVYWRRAPRGTMSPSIY